MRITQFGASLLFGALLLSCSGSTRSDPCDGDCLVAGGGGSVGTGGVSASGGGGPAPPAGPFPDPSAGAASCSQPGVVVDVFDLKGISDWLSRSWLRCAGGPIFQSPHAGLEFEQDGRWHFLDLKDGSLVRRGGFAGGGEWTLVDTSSMNGPGALAVQLDIQSWQGGTIPSFVRFAVEPMKLNLSAYPGVPSEYLAVNPVGAPPACEVCGNPRFLCTAPGKGSLEVDLTKQTAAGCEVSSLAGPAAHFTIHCDPPQVCSSLPCEPATLTSNSFAWDETACSAIQK